MTANHIKRKSIKYLTREDPVMHVIN